MSTQPRLATPTTDDEPMEYERVAALLRSHPYRFAKTMPSQPHWYTLRDQWADDDAFTEVVSYIRTHGYVEVYKRSKYKMLDVDDLKYWTMFYSPERTTLINRTFIADERRDALATWLAQGGTVDTFIG